MAKLFQLMKMMEHLNLDELYALREFLYTLIHTLEKTQKDPVPIHENEREIVE